MNNSIHNGFAEGTRREGPKLPSGELVTEMDGSIQVRRNLVDIGNLL